MMNILTEKARKIFEAEKGRKSFMDCPFGADPNFDDLWPSEQQPYFRRAEREIQAIYDPIS
jgi:hypothetical protein